MRLLVLASGETLSLCSFLVTLAAVLVNVFQWISGRRMRKTLQAAHDTFDEIGRLSDLSARPRPNAYDALFAEINARATGAMVFVSKHLGRS
ncbi:MAG: hypothetical protein JXA69_05535 [Phycisphaerae bacterium]|nr:hypothetical protein [Phycisphaerae bacterium]